MARRERHALPRRKHRRTPWLRPPPTASPDALLARESFQYRENERHLEWLDEIAGRSGVSRGRAFEDLLDAAVCALSGGAMEDRYQAIVERHRRGSPGKRGIDLLAQLFGSIVAAMETTREEMRDVLGDLFQGGITHGEAGQYLTPEPVCRAMARMTIGEISEEAAREVKRVCDPACGSGRMLLGVAEIHRHWEFHGCDIDLRCTRMAALNLALRNLTGYVVHGDSLAGECRLVYETGRIWKGSVIRELSIQEAPEGVRKTVEDNNQPQTPPRADESALPHADPARPPRQLRLF